jgi:polyisoprenoid-binding protein YceI
VEGKFSGFKGTVVFNPGDLENSFFDVCIDPSTVNTGIKSRDRALLGKEYFDADTYKTICFISDSITKSAEGYLTTGILTIKGISRKIAIPFAAENNVLSGTLEIDRSYFNIGPSGGFLIGKTVKMNIVKVLDTENPG